MPCLHWRPWRSPAGAIIVGGSVHAQSHDVLIGLMVVGALNALGIHTAVASLRGASTLTTGGIANPAVSLFEDAGAAVALILAFLAPFVAAALAIAFTIALLFLVRWLHARAFRAQTPQA